MVPMAEQIPDAMRLVRPPSRDDREIALPELRTEDGHVMALVEEIPGDSVN